MNSLNGTEEAVNSLNGTEELKVILFISLKEKQIIKKRALRI